MSSAKNSFNDAAFNTARDGMEAVFDKVEIFEKSGRKTAYVSDVTLWVERPLYADWIKSTYSDVTKVSFGASDKNVFNQAKKALGIPDAPRGQQLFSGALYLDETKKPFGLKPDPAMMPPMM